eukprot:7192701-Alexandrium_andersonii.AAC.1
MVWHGWAVRCADIDSLWDLLGAREFPNNRLALVSKLRPDSTMKRRFARGLRRSLVDSLVRQGGRVVLPRLSDVVANAVERLREVGADQVSFLGADVADAFHQVPLCPGEC